MCALHFEDTIADFKNRNVKGSASKVKDQNCFVFVTLIKTIGKSGRGWLVDDSQNL